MCDGVITTVLRMLCRKAFSNSKYSSLSVEKTVKFSPFFNACVHAVCLVNAWKMMEVQQ